MTPEEFIAHWKDNDLNERAGAQQHFNDLCEVLGVEKPRDRENYCFERGAKKSGGGDGWADVWKRGYFGWENKKPGRNLDTAYKQLTDYAGKLDTLGRNLPMVLFFASVDVVAVLLHLSPPGRSWKSCESVRTFSKRFRLW